MLDYACEDGIVLNVIIKYSVKTFGCWYKDSITKYHKK